MPKASVAVAVIAKNSGKTIAAMLDSVVPYVEQVVVCVDELSTDDTAAIALRHGAKVVQGHKVSEWHECSQHGRVLAQHFARARDESFKHLREDVEWWMWLDSDDVLKGAEKLAEFLKDVPEEFYGIWLPYHYSSTPNGKPSTLFDRERLLRRKYGWEWIHRVHEVAKPKYKSSEEVPWLKTDQIQVIHQDKGHDTSASAKRNILLLEIELEERPGDPWALQYLGNQYFALEDWPTAIDYFESSLNTPNVYQKWLTHVYRSMAYEKMGNGPRSASAAFDALTLRPQHPEPYYRLAALSMLRNDLKACEVWTHIGDQMEPVPPVVFSNPMDRLYNARITLGQAYFNNSEPVKARREWERALAVVPNGSIQSGVETCRQLEEGAARANAFLTVLDGRSDQEVRNLQGVLGIADGDLWRYGRLRDRVAPALLKTRPNTQPRIVFWCGRAAEPWGPPSLNTTGIGGSETAVVQIAWRFAAAGWRVDVYNEPDKYEGEHDGVGYWSLNRLGGTEKAEVLVSWRNPASYGLPIDRRVSLLWCHDLNSGPAVRESFHQWNKVLGVSRWHGQYLAQVYGLDNTDHVPNGIDLRRFGREVAKVPFRCVYASSPDRGLDRLLMLWPDIVKTEPTAELHIAYGWDTIDKYIASGATHLIPLKQGIERQIAETPNVKWRGRLPQDELARLYQESYAWLYPSSFTEVSCITAMEAMAGGCVPVTSSVGALPETIGDAGLIVTGNTYTQSWKEFYVLCARAALMDRTMRLDLAAKGQERAKALSWDASFEKWQSIIAGQLEGSKEEEKEMVAV